MSPTFDILRYRQLGELTDAIKHASNADVEARDRVDITLKEYECMKQMIKELTGLVHDYEAFFQKINFPFGEDVIPESIETTFSDNFQSSPLDPGKFRVRIEFEVKRRQV